MLRALADKLMDRCANNAPEIVNEWYKALSTNARTGSYSKLMPRESCLRHASEICVNLGKMYFADNCYQAVAQPWTWKDLLEDHYARGDTPA